nr:hypothetical protein Iba_chr12aCG10090 [Ipomoea batatas]
MVIIVQSKKSWRMTLWMTTSVWESTEAVASSMNRILLFFSITLPKHSSCRCPTLQLSPASGPEASSCPCLSATTCFNWQRSRLFHICWSEYSPSGSMLLLTVPSKRTGS